MSSVRRDIQFRTLDNVVLRGWFFPAAKPVERAPTISMAHGFAGVKEMELEVFAGEFVNAGLNVLIHDHRGFGDSDTGPHSPRQEILYWQQLSDWSDAITFAQSLVETDPTRIGIWGSSFSGGLAIQLAATDKRVRAVSAQIPMISGSTTFKRRNEIEARERLWGKYQAERLSRASGKPATMLVVSHPDVNVPCCMTSPEARAYTERICINGAGRDHFVNEITLRSLEQSSTFEPGRYIDLISPTPLLLTVAELDKECPADLALAAFEQALKPKQINILHGATHFDAYGGAWFPQNCQTQVNFFKSTLLPNRKDA